MSFSITVLAVADELVVWIWVTEDVMLWTGGHLILTECTEAKYTTSYITGFI